MSRPTFSQGASLSRCHPQQSFAAGSTVAANRLTAKGSTLRRPHPSISLSSSVLRCLAPYSTLGIGTSGQFRYFTQVNSLSSKYAQ